MKERNRLLNCDFHNLFPKCMFHLQNVFLLILYWSRFFYSGLFDCNYFIIFQYGHDHSGVAESGSCGPCKVPDNLMSSCKQHSQQVICFEIVSSALLCEDYWKPRGFQKLFSKEIWQWRSPKISSLGVRLVYLHVIYIWICQDICLCEFGLCSLTMMTLFFPHWQERAEEDAGAGWGCYSNPASHCLG